MRSNRPPAKPMAGNADLQNIEDALGRLETGSFGYCQSCGEPISLARLCKDPTVSQCSDCDEV